MKRVRQVVGLLMCTAITCTAVAAQVPQRDTRKPVAPVANAAPAPEGTSTLAGTVVADASGAPVRLAYVVLVGAGTGVLKVTSTDQAGKFSFTKLPADRYTVGASKLPYLGAVAGARRPARPGVPIVLAHSATITDVVIRLPKSAALSGIVYDERGQPAPGVIVNAEQRKMQNGERVLVGGGGIVTTDDRGFYRLHGLVPGEYVISAMPQRFPAAGARALTDSDVDAALRGTPLPGQQVSGADGQTIAYAPVYYPGTTRFADAQGVLVAAGDDRQNLDLRIERAQVGRIEGSVVNADGTPGQVSIIVSSAASYSRLSTTQSVSTRPDGSFRTGPLGPGKYTVLARRPGQQGGQFAMNVVELSGVDISGLQMTLQPPLNLEGRVVVKGASPAPAVAGQRIQMRPLGAFQPIGAMPLVSAVSAAGTFTATNLIPGRYLIGNAPYFGASSASVTWGLESVVIDGKDVTDLAVDIVAEALPKEVVVTFGDALQQLSGRLTDSAGKGVSDFTVMVFPTNEAYWLHDSRRIVTMQPGTDGRFTIGGPGPALLPAGEYYLAAVTDVSKDEQYDPAFLQSLIGAAIKVTLAPGGKQTQDLRVR